jgi:sigma-54 dependent transcriptional regulator, acetoin dehydrogenase operon transcriptional activator AcoR
MCATPIATRTPPGQLREARRRLLACGELDKGLLGPALGASWQRSHNFGLVPDGKTPGAPHASGAQLARALEQWRSFVAQARPVMEFLSEQIRDSGSIVILADSQGMLLHALGDTSFADKAARVALRPGAIWHEQWRGTNAIGTALAEGSAVVVHGAEHYLARNAFLTCTAAPIIDPTGTTLGALDISGDRLSHQRHTLGLVRSSVRMVEHQLFQARFGLGLQLRLHAQAEGIGTVTEGLLALSDSGWIIGANTVALGMLGLSWRAIGSCTLESLLGVDLPALLQQPSRTGPLPRLLRRTDGTAVWARLDHGRTPSTAVRGGVRAARSPSTATDALGTLDTGDGAMQAIIGRARRVLDKPIALLLQGESGVGKELFARACHNSGARRSAAFVAVNCAALPETLIEAELFGYKGGAFTGASREGSPGRIREAHGGTLFLDEIGDMPLALQARLLRVLQERQVTPLGGGQAVAVDFQLICATHQRLRDDIQTGRFREDLYYRINGLALQLPALRERSDLPTLVTALLGQLEPERALQLAPDVARAFNSFKWPGNLRQLCNVLRTACALLDEHETIIEWGHLPDDVAEDLISQPRPRRVEDEQADLRLQAERCIEQTVRDSDGNLSEAARRLGISRNTLYRKLRANAG